MQDVVQQPLDQFRARGIVQPKYALYVHRRKVQHLATRFRVGPHQRIGDRGKVRVIVLARRNPRASRPVEPDFLQPCTKQVNRLQPGNLLLRRLVQRIVCHRKVQPPGLPAVRRFPHHAQQCAGIGGWQIGPIGVPGNPPVDLFAVKIVDRPGWPALIGEQDQLRIIGVAKHRDRMGFKLPKAAAEAKLRFR